MTDILNGMCEEEKNNMRALRNDQLGSCEKAVMASDGVWHTRGHFSKNGSFIIKNYLTGVLLWFGHKCMRGKVWHYIPAKIQPFVCNIVALN